MRTPILAGVIAALILLPGCAAAGVAPSATVPATSVASSSVPSDQSKLEACDELAATMEDASTTLSESMQLMSSDPEKALTALTSFAASLESAVAKVSNPEVKAQGEKAVAAIKELTGALDTMIKNPADAKPDALTSALATMSTELTAIGTVCAS